MSEHRGSRLSWVEEGQDVAAPLGTWALAVGTCALAALASLGEPPEAALAAVALVIGATIGRAARLDRHLRTTGAWMWAIGAGCLLVLAGSLVPIPPVGPLLALLLLPLDWRLLPRLRTSVGAGVVFAALAVVGRAPPRVGLLAAWAPLALLTLLLLERDVRRAGRQAGNHRPPGSATGPSDATRTARDALALGAVAAVAVILSLVVLPPPPPAPAAGRAGNGGRDDAVYRGFGDELDMAVRAPQGDDLVARVRADTAALWRGDSFEQFDGRRWSHRGGTALELGGAERLVVPESSSPSPAGALAVPTDEQVQVFTFERGGNDLVFGANRPRMVLVPGTATWYGGSDAIRLDEPLGRGGSYTVISARPRLTEDVLRSLDAAQADALATGAALSRPGAHRPAGTDPFAPYLAVPASTSARTRALAAEVTADAGTTIDRVRALERWLGANTRYRLDIPPLPAGRDAVDQFLFEDRQGYCEQIAAALAVLLRTVGVPTRLAVGYVSDGQDAASGEWLVRARDAHAWVEVWWPGVGWQGFDPTASVPLAPDAGRVGPADRLGALTGPLLLTAVVFLIAGLAVAVTRRLLDRPRPASWAEAAAARLDRAGARAGRPRRADETLIEYADALDDDVLAGAGAPPLGRALSDALFAPAGTGPPTAPAAVEAALREVEGVARRVARERRQGTRRAVGAQPGAPVSRGRS